jgi:diacylglycerol kinase family enzyme
MTSSSSTPPPPTATALLNAVDVVNPLAGGKRALELYNVRKDASNVRVHTLIITTGQMDAHDRLLALPDLLSDVHLLRVFGGDGLLNECVNAIASLVTDRASGELLWQRASKLRIQMHRCGSSNAVHKHITDALALLPAASTAPADRLVWLDVMRIRAKDGAFTRFATLHTGMALMADFDVLHEQKMRNVPVWAKDVLSPAIAILQYYTRRLTVKFKPVPLDAAALAQFKKPYTKAPPTNAAGWCELDDSFLLIGILNMPWQSGDICMAPNSHSGSLDLMVCRETPLGRASPLWRYELIGLFNAMQNSGAHIGDPRIEYYNVTEVEIVPRETQAATIDGEVHQVTPAGINVTLYPKKLACIE